MRRSPVAEGREGKDSSDAKEVLHLDSEAKHDADVRKSKNAINRVFIKQ